MAEIYDHLEGKETLVVYMAKSGESRINLSGGMLTQSINTRILKDSYDYRPIEQREVEIGERLMCGAVIPGQTSRRIIPTDWVVVETETYSPESDIPGFYEVMIAYCERKPLTLDEFRSLVYETGVTASNPDPEFG